MDCIDRIYFINLDHRADRLAQFQQEVDRMEFPHERVTRISAVSTPEIGVLGCAYSHVKAIQHFLESDAKTCMIFEDDFQFTIDSNYLRFLVKHLFRSTPDFDLVMMGGKIFKEETTDSFFLNRVLDGQTTSGYILSRKFAPLLKANLESGIQLLEQWFDVHKHPHHDYCLDIYWKQLQPQSKWYRFKPKFGVQRESYSDIEKKVTNYGV